jgi:hypothetical protein
VVLKNVRCAYCGERLTPETTTRDHVIGRRFVPKGKFNGRWNLIVNACRRCNNAKSDLEDDIAAITLLPDLTGRFGHEDAIAIEEAQRRAGRSHSRRTGKLVENSQEDMRLDGSLGHDVSASFGLVGPPQIDDERAFELARLHVTALFYMQTYDEESREGGWWQHGYHPLATAHRADWGNATLRGFMEATAAWPYRLHAVTADGFFKALIRRHHSADCWSWALEWNHSLRLIGFFGERAPAQELTNSLTPSRMVTVFQAPGRTVRMREELELAPEDDILFQPPPVEGDE